MFSGLINSKSFKDNDKVKVESFIDCSFVVCDVDRFSIIILENKGDVEINFDCVKGSEYNILFLCPGEIFKACNYSKDAWVISFDKTSSLRKILGFNNAYGNINKIFSLTALQYKKIRAYVKNINSLISEKHIEWNKKVFSIMELIFKISPTYVDPNSNNKLSLVYSFVSFVHEHYTMYHQISFYAKLLEVNSKKITEKFYKEGLLNPHSFIKNRILVEVKRQLIFTDKSVKIICFDVGFNDPAYFSRFFKKNVGITTKEFRIKYTKLT